MRRLRSEAGFSMIELLTVIALFSLLSVSFYQVLFAQASGSDTTRSLARIADEARPGFNRMVRDTREADAISAASATSYTIKVNFDGDGLYETPNGAGDQEILTFAYDEATDVITLNGEVLMQGVDCVRVTPTDPCTTDVFTYSSNFLEYDWNNNGQTTWQEIDESSCATHGVTGVGDCDQPPVLDAAELPYLNVVTFNVRVASGDNSSDFYTTAQLRNRV